MLDLGGRTTTLLKLPLRIESKLLPSLYRGTGAVVGTFVGMKIEVVEATLDFVGDRPFKRASFKCRHLWLHLMAKLGYVRCNPCPGVWQKWVMQHLYPFHTGLPMTIFVGVRVEPELPRLTVSQEYGAQTCAYREWFTMTIPELEGQDPKVIGRKGAIKDADIEKVKSYIKQNRAILLEIWNRKVDVADVFYQLKKYEDKI